MMFYLILTQFIVVGALSLICLHTQGEMAGESVIYGGLVYCIPYLVTSLYLNRPGTETAMEVVVKVWISTIFKFVATGALFVYFFKYTEVNHMTFFLGYIFAFIVQCIMSFCFIKRN